MVQLSRIAAFLCAAGVLSAAAPPNSALSEAKTALARMPLRFEANQGQAAAEVRFTARGGGYTFALTSGGASIGMPGSKPVILSLEKSNRSAPAEGIDQLPVRTDYLVGPRASWRTGVPTYARVRYHDIYPGIDLVYYGNQQQLEYDFVLRPGADPNAIRLRFRGPVKTTVSAEGDLVVSTEAGRIVQKRPVVYQENSHGVRGEVPGRYVMVGQNLAAFRVGAYDRTRVLVIDPVLVYATYFGGTGLDQINAAKLGPRNWLYFVGQIDTNQLVPTDGAVNAQQVGLLDAFLAIVDTTPGSGYPLLYFSYLGGTNADAATAVDVDSNGLAYLTGYTNSTDFPVTGNAYQATGGATQNAFVMVVNPCVSARNVCTVFGGDSITYSTYLGGTSASDIGNAIAVDKAGMLYVYGNTKSDDFPLTDTAFQNFLWGAQDTFLTEIDPGSGGVLYSSYMGGESGLDDGRAILAGSNGLVYFAASTASQNFPVKGFNFNPNPSGGEDVIIGVMDLTKSGDASLVYSTYLGGSGNEEVRAMTFDASGNLLLTGYTLSTDFPTTPDAMSSINRGANDAFVVVFNPALESRAGLVYSTYLGGSHGDSGWAIQGDSAGFIYVAGYTLSPDFPVLNAIQPQWGGGIDIFVTKLKTGIAGPGAIQYSTYVGPSAIYQATALAVAPDGTTFVAGYGYAGLPVTPDALQSTYGGGGADGFLLVLSQ
jgi:hypothetical protein